MSGILSSIATNYAIASAFPSTVKVLVVGGGGGGGAESGSGGGAGGLVYNPAYSITNNTSYPVTVGAGGNGCPSLSGSELATNGGDSIFGTITAYGGGHGVWRGGSTAGSGGCGGGAADATTAGTGSQGGNGGTSSSNPYSAGGGGGAGGNGGNANGNAGVGGIGLENDISGTPTYYAGGGAGGPDFYRGGQAAAGGLGGGGSSSNGGGGGAGTNGLGGGGAGGSNGNPGPGPGGAGGSGVVIISYVGSPIATGGTITSSGGNTIHTFTSSGNFIVGTPPVTYATWNPADKNADLVLSNGNLTATVTSNQWDSVRSTIGKSSGKWYWEVTKDGGSVASVMLQGIALATANIMSGSSYCGVTSDSWGYWGSTGQKINSNSFQAYGATYATGDIIGIALDMDNGTIECFKNGVSQGTMYSGLTGEIFACGSCTDQSFSFTANFGASAFTYTPPVGFNAGLYE